MQFASAGDVFVYGHVFILSMPLEENHHDKLMFLHVVIFCVMIYGQKIKYRPRKNQLFLSSQPGVVLQ